MCSEWSSAPALALLEEMENDPQGYGWLDVQKLLELWGVVDPLPGEDLMGYETRLHPRARDIIFYYPMREELGPETVLTICRSLRRLQHRLSA